MNRCLWLTIVAVGVAACSHDPDSETNWSGPNPGSEVPASAAGDGEPRNPPQTHGDVGGPFAEPDGGPEWNPCKPEVQVSTPVRIRTVVQIEEDIQELVWVEVPAEETEPGERILYVMLDRSLSMARHAECEAGAALCRRFPDPRESKWSLAVDGISRFVRDTSSAGLNVGLGYFPAGPKSTDVEAMDVCGADPYARPAVPVGALPGNAELIVESLGATRPGDDTTPTLGALAGMQRYCEARRAVQPDARCIGVLITDGVPGGCGATDVSALAQTALDAAQSGTQIFAAGMSGADFTLLDAIAHAGGGDCTPEDDSTWACDMTANPEGFFESLQRIVATTAVETHAELRSVVRTITRPRVRYQTLRCEWDIPRRPSKVDPNSVNFRVIANGHSSTIGRVPAAVDCPKYREGWFFKSPELPSRVRACPSTCAALRSAERPVIEALFGCSTLPAVPR